MKVIKKEPVLRFITLLSTLILSGCSLLSPADIHPPKKYTLNEIPPYSHSESKGVSILLLLPPETRPVYNTTQMAYSTQPHQIAFFGYNEWSETPAQMLAPLIIRALQNTQHFKAVVTFPYAGSFDYILSVQIQELVQDYTFNPPILRLALRAQLSCEKTKKVVATKEFSVQEMMLQKTPYGGVIAANQATAKILQKMTDYLLTKIK